MAGMIWANDYSATADRLKQELAAIPPADTLRRAMVSNNLGLAYAHAGRWQDAEKLYRQSLDIFRSRLGPKDPKVATAMNNLGVLYQALGRYDEARQLFSGALAIHETARMTADAVNDLADLAALDLEQRRFRSAESMMKRAIERGGEARPELLNNLGSLYLQLGRLTEASELLERARTRELAEHGRMHRSVGLTTNLLAECALAAGEYAAADDEARDAQAILEATVGPNHPETLATLLTQALVREKTGRPSEAAQLYLRVIVIEDTQAVAPSVRAAHLNAYAALLRRLHRDREAKSYEQLARREGMVSGTVDILELSHARLTR